VTRARDRLLVLVYHHTHWDREWWATFQDFRFRLVQTIDRLLDALEARPEFTSFMLDGQDIVLEDYLEIRPQNRERLVSLVQAGRLHVGPWYVLADQFLTSGEATIRNLWLGERVARGLGVENARVGYLPDQFGHAGQMPQILSGFGIDSAVVWRGFGGPAPEMRSEFWWEAPDGSRVLGVYLAREYHRRHHTPEDTAERLREFVEYMRPYATAAVILEPYGGDHLPVDAALADHVKSVAEALRDAGIDYRIGSLTEYVQLARIGEPDLGVTWKGEGRAYGRQANLLPGVLSARLYLKQANRDAQSQLERYAEPLQALDWMLGGRYEAEYLWTAWKHLLPNHAHDSICGCSIDQVHREMLPRFAEAQQVGELLALTALERLAARIAGEGAPGAEPVIVFNPLNWPRTEAVSVLMNPDLDIEPGSWALYDPAGSVVPFQVRPAARLQRYWRDDWTEVTFTARDLPGLGWRQYRLERRETPSPQGGEGRGGVLENEHLRVDVDQADGTLTVTDKATGLTWSGLNGLWDVGDRGDSYNHDLPPGDQPLVFADAPALEWLERGPARSTLRVTRDWSLPSGLTADRSARAADQVPLAVHSDISLSAGARRVDIRTHFLNAARDHRLQATFPLGAPAATSAAESMFEVVQRPTLRPRFETEVGEPAVDEHPQQGFCSASDGRRGLTIANRGLPEFSCSPDGVLAVTLLRAVGWLSRADLRSRAGEAGPAIPTPEAQVLGPVEARYSIAPHAGTWERARSHLDAHAFNADVLAVAANPQGLPLPFHEELTRGLPAEGVLVEVTGAVVVTAVKRAEDSDQLLVRVLNESPQPVRVGVRPRRPWVAARLLNLREEVLEELKEPELTLRPWQLATFAFAF
jgi:mannosylglycerate hydrolase